MRIAVFDDHRVGLVEGDEVFDVSAAVPDAGPGFPPVYMSRLIAGWDERRAGVLAARAAASPVPLASVRLRAPNPFPLQIFAAPVNYRKHSGELGKRSVSGGATAAERGFFLKASSSVAGAGDRILLPRGSARRFDHEAELAVIIGRRARNVSRTDALRHVFGYCCLIDVTMRIEPGVAEEDRVLRKSFDTFTPMGPWITTADEVPDPGRLSNRLWVNGELRQSANTADMVVDVPGLIELVSSVTALEPGDVIATGTPEGVGPFGPGDRLRLEVEGLGALEMEAAEADEVAPRRF